jgi:hypothetical protein
MRILLANSMVSGIGGGQSAVRDLVRGLSRRGHEVRVFSGLPEPREEMRRQHGMEICDELPDLPFVPDVIHAQHHLATMATLLSLPGVPAVYHCHGAVMREKQPRHPRIYRYLAMSRTLRERILIESGFEPDRVELFCNWFDAKRFVTVRDPAPKIRKALIYHGYHTRATPTSLTIREACRQAGVRLDLAGKRAERKILKPEVELAEYDLVFASGKSAIDALACGCAVMVLGLRGCGPLVTPENFDRLREVNFAIAANDPSHTTCQVHRQITGYDPESTQEVTRRLRTQSELRQALDRLEQIYRQVIEQARAHPPDPIAELSAAAGYLRNLTNYLKFLPANGDLSDPESWIDSRAARAEGAHILRQVSALHKTLSKHL